MKRILILTASFGDGHNTAARNVREAIEALDPGAEVRSIDLIQAAYGKLNQIARATYLGLIRCAPALWRPIYRLLDSAPRVTRGGNWSRLRAALEAILSELQPDCVVSTYPLYGAVVAELLAEYAERPFRLVTVITDSTSINASWFRAPSDLFCVADEDSATVLRGAGIAANRIAVTGFPVPLALGTAPDEELPEPTGDNPRRVLYVLNSGNRKTGRTLEEILAIPHTLLTVTTGRDAALKSRLRERLAPYGGRVRLLGWTNQMPQLLRSHHLVVTKAGGATVQEAVAAGCPLVINQTIPGQEEGNADLVVRRGYGCVVDRPRETARRISAAFESDAALWLEWRRRLERDRRPGAALRIAERVLGATELVGRSEMDPAPPAEIGPVVPGGRAFPGGRRMPKSLLCDFHIHTNYSDGSLTVAEVVDFYGAHGFDCICITDHLADPRRLIGKLSRLSRLVLSPAQIDEYFEVIRREAARAWRRYRMHLLAGIEFNKDGYTPKTSAHLLGIGLSRPVRPDLNLVETIAEIHGQEALAVASHPHVMKSEWGKNTLYLWENQETFAPLLDAWEIANRDNFFSPVALRRLPFIANSDFHKPRHIFSWKTVLHCEKDPEAIKACVRDNRDVSITLYRRREGGENPVPAAAAAESRRAGWRKSPGQMSLAFAEADVA